MDPLYFVVVYFLCIYSHSYQIGFLCRTVRMPSCSRGGGMEEFYGGCDWLNMSSTHWYEVLSADCVRSMGWHRIIMLVIEVNSNPTAVPASSQWIPTLLLFLQALSSLGSLLFYNGHSSWLDSRRSCTTETRSAGTRLMAPLPRWEDIWMRQKTSNL